ncbi:MAG: hypothetical protein KFB93_06425 [Simkaniaceae bacterium]|nr:MAG: hypothetical protein KFB93_06425 [Simkaniaceae bacterium]
MKIPPDSIDSSIHLDDVCTGNDGIGWTILCRLKMGNGFVKSSKIITPINAAENLLKALGKKRLIYQKGLYP